MKQLQPGQVYELHDVYVGSKDKWFWCKKYNTCAMNL
ncbi:Transposase [Bacillus thuringiensis serovar israelensis ATCC 35646]|nr:Transposase [Bacillus thuringiensis serovar israelensis ATCC 35646]